MKIEIYNDSASGFPWGFLVVWAVLWLYVLFIILTRSDIDTPTKILWTIVVIFVPVFGVLFYLFAGPASASAATRKITSGSDVSGTPWADNPSHTGDK